MTQHREQADIDKNIAIGSALDYGTQGIKTDLVAESTAASGVTIDGVVLKDSGVTGDLTGDVTGDVTGNLTLDDALSLGAVDSVTSLGNNIVNATAITGPVTYITAGNNAVGSVMPTAVAGDTIIIHNNAGNGALIYPAVGAAINALGANNALEMATMTAAVFTAFNSVLWYTCPRVPS